MLEVRFAVQLGRSADEVWKMIGDFNGLADWHPWVTASVLEPTPGGIGRRVTINGGKAGLRELTEALVSFDASLREYAYTVVAGPAPFKDYIGRFSIVAGARGRCTFVYHSTFAAADGFSDADAVERVKTFYQAAVQHLPTLFGR